MQVFIRRGSAFENVMLLFSEVTKLGELFILFMLFLEVAEIIDDFLSFAEMIDGFLSFGRSY